MLSPGSLALLDKSLVFFTGVKPCRVGLVFGGATVSLSVSWCTLAFLN